MLKFPDDLDEDSIRVIAKALDTKSVQRSELLLALWSVQGTLINALDRRPKVTKTIDVDDHTILKALQLYYSSPTSTKVAMFESLSFNNIPIHALLEWIAKKIFSLLTDTP